MAAFGVLFDEVVERERMVFRERVNPLPGLTSGQVVERYRLSRELIYEVLAAIRVDIESPTKRSFAVPPIIKLLVTLRYMAKGDFLSEISDIHGILRSSASRAIVEVAAAINRRIDSIHFPVDGGALQQTKREFYSLAGFPNVLGAVDGTLIPIQAPAKDEPDFGCRKGFHAMNIQAVCSAKMRFTNVVCRWAGSVHDSFMFNNCELHEMLSNGDISGWLLGDSGYGLKRHLLTPKLNPQTPGEMNYNRRHAQTRVVIEWAFGILKSRFRCLHKSGGCLLFSPERSMQVISAAFRLHNLCIDAKVPNPPVEEFMDEPDDNPGEVHPHHHDATITRLQIIQRFS